MLGHAGKALSFVSDEQLAFMVAPDRLLHAAFVRAQILRELGRRAEALAELERVAAQGIALALPLHALLSCVVRRRQLRATYALPLSRTLAAGGHAAAIATWPRRAPRASPCQWPEQWQ